MINVFETVEEGRRDRLAELFTQADIRYEIENFSGLESTWSTIGQRYPGYRFLVPEIEEDKARDIIKQHWPDLIDSGTPVFKWTLLAFLAVFALAYLVMMLTEKR